MNTKKSKVSKCQAQRAFPRAEINFKGKDIKFSHWEDWKSSQVDPDLIRANVTSLDGETPYSYLLYSKSLDRTQSGRLSAGLLRRYVHVEDGGWWCNGVDPLNNWQPMTWGCFKPDRPYLDPQKQKPIKYEHPKGIKRGTFYLNLTQRLSQQIYDRHQVPQSHIIQTPIPAISWEDEYLPADRPENAIDSTFWATIAANPAIPVILTEGAKKAACLLSHGYPAIGLPGIHGGYSTNTTIEKQKTVRTIVEELNCIAAPGRTLYIAFDQDTKKTTIHNVHVAIRNLSEILKERGVKVHIISWSGPAKGIDDLVMSEGPQALHKAFNQAKTIEDWLWKANPTNQLTIQPKLRLNTPELDSTVLSVIPDRGVFVLASGKGTGKTNLIAQIVKDAPKVVSLSHRIALQRNTCKRWNLNFKNDLDKVKGRFCNSEGYTLRIGLCVDSILSIRGEDIKGGILVIDEFMQVLRHLFTSETCAQKGNRGALIEHLNYLISIARLVILADADANDLGVNYIQQWRSPGDQPPTIVLNEYVGPNFDAIFLETQKIEDAYQRLIDDITLNKKIFVATDGRKAATKLAKKLKRLFPTKTGLLISSETSGEQKQRAFITDPNLHTQRYDWVIATPSLGTGISIEIDHYDLVYGLFNGILTDSDAAQALNRVRAKVPRTIWVTSHSKHQHPVSQSQNPKVIQRSIRRRSLTHSQITRSQLGYKLSPHDRLNDLTHSEPSVDFYCDLVAMENASHNSLRDSLKARLKDEGSKIIEIIPKNHTDELAKEMRDIGRQIQQDEAEAIAQAQNLTPAEVREFNRCENLTQAEKQALEKYRTQSFYCKAELTIEEIIFYGKYGNFIQQLEALLHGCNLSNIRDQAERNKQLQWGRLLTPWDFKYHELKRGARERLGLQEFLNAKAEWTSKSLEDFANKARACRQEIKLYLNLTIKEDSNNNWILSQLLTQLGLKTKLRHRGRRGNQEAVYSLDDEHLAIVNDILQRRQEYRLEQQAIEESSNSDNVTTLVSTEPYLYSDAGAQYENPSSNSCSNPAIFISTELTVQRFKNWVFGQDIFIRRFFYPDRYPNEIEITPTQ